jgi:lysophospholipase L1-like esterase
MGDMKLRERAPIALVVAGLLCVSRVIVAADSATFVHPSLPLQIKVEGTPGQKGIVFIGSSIFQFWTHLTEQMAPLPVLNRAIAGTVTQDMLDRIDQLVIPYHPRIVVYYCGSNDISAGEAAEPIVERTQRFIRVLHQKSPDTFFYYTAIQKAPEKRERWNIVDTVNREMERYSHQAENVGFIDLNPVLFSVQGKLREELFLSDGLHFRPDSSAYPEFARVVKPVLTKAWQSGAGLAKKQ